MSDAAADPGGGAKAQRTRRDIVSAAISCWSVDSSASLGTIAGVADVGRTTLNRYFTNRPALIAAVDAECRERFRAAAVSARPEEGSGLTALQRLCVQIVDLGEVLGLIFADNPVVDPDNWTEGDGGEDPLAAAVRRGCEDGSIDDDLPLDWVVTLAWSSLFAAWLALRSGATTRFEVAQLMTRTLTRGIQAS